MKDKAKIKNIILTVFTLLLLTAMAYRAELFSSGAASGISLCLESVLPSMLPFMFLSSFIAVSGAADLLGSLFGRPFFRLFRISSVSASAFIMSLVGGYPIGIKTAYALYEAGKIEQSEFKKLCIFCMCGGPGFIIGTVGNGFYGSRRAGLILYFSSALSCVLLALAARLFFKGESEQNPSSAYNVGSLSGSFFTAAKKASKAVLEVCFLIVLFSSAQWFLSGLPDSAALRLLLSVLEVTTAVKSNITVLSLPLISALIGFGGICVHIQVMPEIVKSGTGVGAFFISRLAHGALSFLCCRLLLFFFPIESGAFKPYSEPIILPYSVSLPAAVSLLISCGLMVWELANRRKMW